jgi:hypothetical protein
MALSVKQLNADASFLLSFEPILDFPAPAGSSHTFRILVDPWITGPSKIFHSMLSLTTHKEPACISSLQDLPEPDLVVISQHRSDHCNEATLRQLPSTGTKTVILAEPSAAKAIRGWRYFDKDKVRTIPRWGNPRLAGREAVIRVRVPPLLQGGDPGEVTVAFISQKRDIKRLHAAIGITYRPPRYRQDISPTLLTPPSTPNPQASNRQSESTPTPIPFHTNTLFLAPPTPPPTPDLPSLGFIHSTPSLTPHTRDRSVSVLFSPHGISYRQLEPYATSHLVSEAALPLTALLHCFDSVSNPWWLGGTISSGMPAGQEIANALCPRAWISTHDADKDVRGLMTRMLKTIKYAPDGIAETSSSGRGEGDKDGAVRTVVKSTEMRILKVGEEVALANEGVRKRGGTESFATPVT